MIQVKRSPSATFALLAFGLCLVLFSKSVSAASPANSLTVSPANLNFRLQSETKTQIIPVNLTNNSNAAISLTAQFMGIDTTRGQLIPAGNVESSLSDSLSVDRTELTIPAKATQILNVAFSDTPNLSPGGHYATLVITQEAGGGQLGLQSAASLTIFATKLDGANPRVDLKTTKLNGWLFALPSIATLNFGSSGNVLVVPRAAITISAGTKLLVNGIANQASLPILPGNQRVIIAPLHHISNQWLPRRVTVNITYRADGVNTTQTVLFKRWYVPSFYPILLLILGAIATWLTRHPRGKQFRKWLRQFSRRHNRKSTRFKVTPVVARASRKIFVSSVNDESMNVDVKISATKSKKIARK